MSFFDGSIVYRIGLLSLVSAFTGIGVYVAPVAVVIVRISIAIAPMVWLYVGSVRAAVAVYIGICVDGSHGCCKGCDSEDNQTD